MKNRVLSFLFLLALSSLSHLAMAQFQGQIKMNVYSDDNGTPEVNEVNMYVTPQRIMLQGESAIGLDNGFNAQGLLIRNDKKDFVVLTGEKSALQVTKSDIQNLINFSKNMGGNESSGTTSNTNYNFTGKERTILGKKTTQLIIEDEDEGGYLSIWLTPDVDINWGMLTESWSGLDSDMDRAFKTSQETVFKGKSFPLLVEAYSKKKDKLYKVAEVVELNESSVAKAMVEIPQGVSIMGFGDFMFKMMMQQ